MKQELLHDNYLEMRFSRVFSFIKELVSLRLMLLCVLVISGLTLGTQEAKCANKYTYSYVYLDLSGFTSWANDGATFKVQLNTWENCTGGEGDTVSMNAVPGVNNLYYADVSSVITTDRYGLQFQRCTSDGSSVLHSFCVAYSSGNCGVPSNSNAGSMTTKTFFYSLSAPSFPDTNVGSSTDVTFTFLSANLDGLSPQILNGDGSFTYQSGSSTITANGLTSIVVRFAPTTTGTKTATLYLPYAGGGLLQLSISGTASSLSCSTPTSGFEASGTYNSGNWTTRFTNDHRSATLSTEQLADAYRWECTSADSSKVSIASNTSKSTTATFDLPGEYTFRVGAKCTAGGGYTYSQTVTVNVPYPEIGISGPFYDGSWNHTKAGTDGKFTRNGLVYTKDFTVNTSNGEFVIIQAYKLGCESNDGWAGWTECNGDGKGNKINCSTFSTSTTTINTSSCGNFTQNAGLSNGQTARLTVTMTAYDSYTMSLGLACTPPTGGTATASASSVCSGSGTTITLTGNTGTIQWQSSTNGTDYSNISGQTSSTLSTGNLTVKTWYRAVVTSGSCSSNSSAAEVTIKTSPVISAISGSATTTQYKPETYTASGSNLGTLTWAIVGAPAHANISATTGSSTVFKAKNGSYTLSVTATNDGCTDNETLGITVNTDSETCE